MPKKTPKEVIEDNLQNAGVRLEDVAEMNKEFLEQHGIEKDQLYEYLDRIDDAASNALKDVDEDQLKSMVAVASTSGISDFANRGDIESVLKIMLMHDDPAFLEYLIGIVKASIGMAIVEGWS